MVINEKGLVCHLTKKVIRGLNIDVTKVYITTRVLKHMYDKRPAQEMDFILKNLSQLVKYPDEIYANKDGKRANFSFVKKLKNPEEEKYFCGIEIDGGVKEANIVTVFCVAEIYLKNYKLLWSWRDDIPSS